MAFESLAEKIQGAFKKLTNRGKLTESDVKEAMRDVRMALLEADVNYSLVKDFIKKVTERAVGSEILSSLTPAQQVIKIVNEELTNLMGGTNARLTYSPQVPTIYMMCGLQGAGKTTMCAKLGKLIAKDGKRPLLVACDVYRPAAIRQLQIVGGQAGVEVFEQAPGSELYIGQTVEREQVRHVAGQDLGDKLGESGLIVLAVDVVGVVPHPDADPVLAAVEAQYRVAHRRGRERAEREFGPLPSRERLSAQRDALRLSVFRAENTAETRVPGRDKQPQLLR